MAVPGDEVGAGPGLADGHDDLADGAPIVGHILPGQRAIDILGDDRGALVAEGRRDDRRPRGRRLDDGRAVALAVVGEVDHFKCVMSDLNSRGI